MKSHTAMRWPWMALAVGLIGCGGPQAFDNAEPTVPGIGDLDKADSAGNGCYQDQTFSPNAELDVPPGEDGCPDGMVRIGDSQVCIDGWEAHLVIGENADLQALSPYLSPSNPDARARSAPGAVPQAYINELQAERACLNAGKRLCTRSEWERACRGPDNWTYPYGPEREPGTCNDARDKHPAIEYYGTSADWIWSKLSNPCINQLPDSLALTGAHEGCQSAYGAFDMMGNLHEWIADPKGTFKGGYYVDTFRNGNGCLYTTTAHGASYSDYSTGFRCCADR